MARATGRGLDRAIIVVLAIAVVLLLTIACVGRKGAGLQSGTMGAMAAPAKIPVKSVAVLPLLNESGDVSDEYFSDGPSEEPISALGQVRDLKVIGRNSSFQFRGTAQTNAAGIGAKLDVATLLEGTQAGQKGRFADSAWSGGANVVSATPSLLSELKRRNVLRAAVLYAGAVWALAQGLAQLLPLFGDCGWIARWFVIAACIGLPFWIAFAWFYEIT
ncbi:MAG TPA: hypothetical protein VJ722_10830, partial [Rhodanobacteraceae bacterium]|nr:hypothetical protein [Rhodanobacteraceae bacterium]